MAKGFLYTEKDSYLGESSDKLCNMKSCLFSGTRLFIFVLTNICNQRCIYCQAGHAYTSLMSVDVCKKAIELAVQSPVSGVTIEFQGGEPTANSTVLKFAIPYAKSVFDKHGKHVDFSIVTNFTNSDTALLNFLIAEDVSFSTSLDGPKTLHDLNRPLSSNESSYEKWKTGLNTQGKTITSVPCKLRLGSR